MPMPMAARNNDTHPRKPHLFPWKHHGVTNMRLSEQNIREIVKSLELIGRSTGIERAFRDWMECAAIAFANGCDLVHGERWKKREKRYLEIISRYGADSALYLEMLALLVNAFESDPWKDHLGRVYMECFGGNKNLGQCFTPESVCGCCASLVGVPANGEPCTLFEPACGGGAMIIAYLEKCHDAGYDYQRLLRIDAADLDALCVHMCYVQLSILGARATVRIADSIADRTFDTFVTPMEVLWPSTLVCDSAKS